MSHTNHRRTDKPPSRRGMYTSRWKNSDNTSHCDAVARSEWKRISSRIARRKDKVYEKDELPKQPAKSSWRNPRNRK